MGSGIGVKGLHRLGRHLADVVWQRRCCNRPPEGDQVNADARLFEADNLTADEAMLTGESEPVIKNTKIIRVELVPLAERKNMVFMGTTITHGNGTAMVTGTGSHTEMGKISDLLQETVEEKTPLEVKLDKLGHSLIGITFIVTAIIALIGIITGRCRGVKIPVVPP